MAGSSLLLEPPFGTRSALAVVVPTRCSSLQLVFVLVSLLLNFHLIIFLCWLAEWRQTSTWNSCACATRCRSPPWGSCATHRCICGEPTHCTRGAATIFFQLAARAVGCFVKASSSTCCTMGVRVEAFDACCSNGAAMMAKDRARAAPSLLPALHPHSLLAEPTCRGGSAGGCLCASTSSSSQGARDGSNPATHGERARADVMCVCVLSSRQGH